MYWTLELASKLEDAPWPATKDELIDFAIRSGAPMEVIEKEIDLMEETLPSLKNFILPGGNTLVSYCHITRCVCRRAERAVSVLNKTEESPEIVNKFLNRLSDFLFVLSRKIALELDIEEIKWQV